MPCCLRSWALPPWALLSANSQNITLKYCRKNNKHWAGKKKNQKITIKKKERDLCSSNFSVKRIPNRAKVLV